VIVVDAGHGLIIARGNPVIKPGQHGIRTAFARHSHGIRLDPVGAKR
jgi:hypothetical protein